MPVHDVLHAVIDKGGALQTWIGVRHIPFYQGIVFTNYAQYSAGVKGVAEFLDPEVANSPESNPPEGTKTVFVEACPEEVQVLYDAIWTNLKK